MFVVISLVGGMRFKIVHVICKSKWRTGVANRMEKIRRDFLKGLYG